VGEQQHNGHANHTANGSSATTRAEPAEPPPQQIAELAEACVRFVERAVGVKLDYTPETLPLLDHYLEGARSAARERPETAPLIAHAAGAYLGEVVRRRYASWWRMDSDDPTTWRVELESVYLAFTPIVFVADTLMRPVPTDDDLDDDAQVDIASIELDEADRETVAARLAELPPVSEAEYYSPSTRVEVIDIAVEEVRARRLAEDIDPDASLEPADYD
jgi:hypothetical protein